MGFIGSGVQVYGPFKEVEDALSQELVLVMIPRWNTQL